MPMTRVACFCRLLHLIRKGHTKECRMSESENSQGVELVDYRTNTESPTPASDGG